MRRKRWEAELTANQMLHLLGQALVGAQSGVALSPPAETIAAPNLQPSSQQHVVGADQFLGRMGASF